MRSLDCELEQVPRTLHSELDLPILCPTPRRDRGDMGPHGGLVSQRFLLKCMDPWRISERCDTMMEKYGEIMKNQQNSGTYIMQFK